VLIDGHVPMVLFVLAIFFSNRPALVAEELATPRGAVNQQEETPCLTK
jgi:hypothetical protein